MNILDITEEEVKKALKEIDAKDTFDLFMKIGKKYQTEYHSKPVDLNTREGQSEFRRISCYIIEELMEMQNLLKIREWSETEYPVDDLHFSEEYVDFMNFVMQIPIMLGWSEEKIQELMVKKYLINKFRKKTQY